MNNNAAEALKAAEEKYAATFEKHLNGGVCFISRNVYIEPEVEIAAGATILPSTILRGKTVIAEGCVIGPNTLLENAVVGANSVVNASQVYDSVLGENANIGPFAHIRVGTKTAKGVHLGAYVETKNASFGEGSTVSHLTYIGDSQVGKYCNFGCGTVTCNYDGIGKYKTEIGDYVFIGCNTNLVAPVKVGSGAYTAAGSTITGEVPEGALAVARSRQKNIEGYAAKKLIPYIEKKKKKEKEQQG